MCESTDILRQENGKNEQNWLASENSRQDDLLKRNWDLRKAEKAIDWI